EDRQGGGDAVQHALDVGVDEVLPGFDRELVERPGGADPGVGHQHVQPAEPHRRQLDQGSQVLAAADIGLLAGNLTTRAGDPCGQVRQPFRPPGAQDQPSAAPGQVEPDPLADPGTGPGDGHDLALDSRHAASGRYGPPVMIRRAYSATASMITEAGPRVRVAATS